MDITAAALPWLQNAHLSLTSLDAAFSPIAAAFPVARFLSSIFFLLRTVTVNNSDSGNALEYALRWEEVETLLPGLFDIREEEWAHGNQWALQTMASAATTMALNNVQSSIATNSA
ncbi:hypothetical protein DFH07DRAFT_952804 [Mycena maculata]|uniref:Uncharacterized protein n=1 Tax=Mycena maculata TaxID=230809 RepID=A0AAD7JXW9_9AGAR|nr:hypothetical protein DFH07DRAFT_952804 [Mycena maculata]